MRKKDTKLKRLSILAKISKRVSSNYLWKRDRNIPSFGYLEVRQQLKLRRLPTSFLVLTSEGRDGNVHVHNTKTKKNFKVFPKLILSEDHKWSIFDFFVTKQAN